MKKQTVLHCKGIDRRELNRMLEDGWLIVASYPIVVGSTSVNNAMKTPMVEYVLEREE